MKQLVVFLFLLVPLFSLAQDEAALVQRVKARLDKVKNYKASGRMTVDVSFMDVPPSDVDIYYKNPDKFAVRKKDGLSLLPRNAMNVNMSALLAGGAYDVIPSKPAAIDGKNMTVVKLLPNAEGGKIILTTLFIDADKEIIRRAVVNTSDNGTYTIDMSYGKQTQWGLPDQLVFTFDTKDFKLPKGLTFEYEKGGSKKPQSNGNKKGKVTLQYQSYQINKGVEDKYFQ